MAWSAKWTRLREGGKDFLTTRNKTGGPADVGHSLCAEHPKGQWWLDKEDDEGRAEISIMGYFRIGVGSPDFKWTTLDDEPEDPKVEEWAGGGGCAAHLVARHPENSCI